MKNELCIMQNDLLWRNKRFPNSHRHEIFGGAFRQKSIEDGLVIFLTPELHNMSNRGIHYDKEFMLYAKKKGQKRWMEFYNKTEEQFVSRYGKSYI